ncbi:chemotaxis protein CheW [Methylocucumis oryzae]|uniref:chemotaxis protein CheW n=1 Tax=Methylocucumis oryzae TaxID=1632867 RepID=UPI001EF9E6F4|nr:chemotaxis protein CheW [Methylocucumis oryzae]
MMSLHSCLSLSEKNQKNVGISEREVINYPQEPIVGETIDLATFYIGNEVFAFTAHDVLEAVDVSLLNYLPGVKSYILGSVIYSDNSPNGHGEHVPIIVIDGKILTQTKPVQNNREKLTGEIIVVRTKKGLIGLLVDALDAIPTFEKGQMRKLSELLRSDGGYIKALVNIQDSSVPGKMLVVLDQDLILSAVRKEQPVMDLEY